MERDGGGAGEGFVCFFTTLYGPVISWEEVGEMVGLFFSFSSFLRFLFFLVVSHSCPRPPPPPPPFSIFLFSSFHSEMEIEMILTRSCIRSTAVYA